VFVGVWGNMTTRNIQYPKFADCLSVSLNAIPPTEFLTMDTIVLTEAEDDAKTRAGGTPIWPAHVIGINLLDIVELWHRKNRSDVQIAELHRLLSEDLEIQQRLGQVLAQQSREAPSMSAASGFGPYVNSGLPNMNNDLKRAIRESIISARRKEGGGGASRKKSGSKSPRSGSRSPRRSISLSPRSKSQIKQNANYALKLQAGNENALSQKYAEKLSNGGKSENNLQMEQIILNDIALLEKQKTSLMQIRKDLLLQSKPIASVDKRLETLQRAIIQTQLQLKQLHNPKSRSKSPKTSPRASRHRRSALSAAKNIKENDKKDLLVEIHRKKEQIEKLESEKATSVLLSTNAGLNPSQQTNKAVLATTQSDELDDLKDELQLLETQIESLKGGYMRKTKRKKYKRKTKKI
jgi:hypothetical protein